MALRYPFLIVIIFIVIVLYFMINKKKKEMFSIGSKIANTSYLKNSSYYKKKIKEFNLLKKIIFMFLK